MKNQTQTPNKSLHLVKEEYPSANIFVSAILPRKITKDTFNNFNEKVADVNNYLRQVAADDDTTIFIGNSNSFKQTDHKHYYLPSDRSGVHLCKPGQEKLIEIIEQAVDKNNASLRKKRNRANQETPPSAEKDRKSMKLGGSGSLTG